VLFTPLTYFGQNELLCPELVRGLTPPITLTYQGKLVRKREPPLLSDLPGRSRKPCHSRMTGQGKVIRGNYQGNGKCYRLIGKTLELPSLRGIKGTLTANK